MPELLTQNNLAAAVRDGTFIEQGDEASVDGIKIDLHMGDLFLKAQYVQPMRVSELPAVERSALHIDPGEVVFVMTKERLHLPADMMASLSPKRTLAHGGIVILGGLAVDPGYWGSLWLGLYNASSTNYPLSEGKKLISALFYKLSPEEIGSTPGLHMTSPSSTFPEELTAMIAKYRPVDSKGLQDQFQELRTELRKLRDDVTSDNQWKSDFKRSLDDLLGKTKEGQDQIVAIGKLLQKETETREAGEREIKKDISTVIGDFKGLRNWRSAALAIFSGLAALILASVYHIYIEKPTPPQAPATFIVTPSSNGTVQVSPGAPARSGAH